MNGIIGIMLIVFHHPEAKNVYRRLEELEKVVSASNFTDNIFVPFYLSEIWLFIAFYLILSGN